MIHYQSTFLKVAFALALLTGTYSCNPNKPEDSKEAAEESNDSKLETNSGEKNAQFLVEVSEINMEEVSLGRLALMKGTSSHVKELAQMMVDEHTKSMTQLTSLAKTKMVTLPTTETEKVQESYKKLDEKTGMDFDKKYCGMMVDGHKDAISKFENASESSDLEIKTWANDMLPGLRMHLKQSEDCQKKCEAMAN